MTATDSPEDFRPHYVLMDGVVWIAPAEYVEDSQCTARTAKGGRCKNPLDYGQISTWSPMAVHGREVEGYDFTGSSENFVNRYLAQRCSKHWESGAEAAVEPEWRLPELPATDCVFCKIAAGDAPADIVFRTWQTIGIVPLGPVTPGHILVIPHAHVTDAADEPDITAETMRAAAEYAGKQGAPFNLITSAGAVATQTVFHLHIHYVPRSVGDGLALPWTGQARAA